MDYARHKAIFLIVVLNMRHAIYDIRMNNIVFCIFCLCLIFSRPVSSNDLKQQACAPFTKDLPKSAENFDNYPFTDSLIWKAEKNDKANYVYGTIHTQDQFATRFPHQIRLAIFQSNTYLMEIKLSHESNAVFQQAMFYDNGISLEEKFDPVLINILGNQLAEYGYKNSDAKRIKPWAAFSTIGSPKPIRSPSLDQVLMNFAQSRGLEVIGIETMQELVDTLSSIPEQDQLIILADTVCNRAEIIAKTKDLVDMHMRNDMLGIVKFNEQPHQDEALFERFMQTMVYDRNVRMVERVLPYFEQGKSVMAVGALHLPGEKGILSLLEQNGFTLTPL